MLASTRGRFGAATVAALVMGVCIGLAVHLSRSSNPAPARALTLPVFHGQGEWAAGARPAPAFVLRDQHGRAVGLSSQRGRPVLIAFLAAAPRSLTAREAMSLADTEALLPPAQRPLLDVIGLDPASETPADISAAAARWHLSSPYRWLTGPRAVLQQTLHAYGVDRRRPRQAGGDGTPLYLVDRQGYERAGYLYPFFPTVLAGDLKTLSRLDN